MTEIPSFEVHLWSCPNKLSLWCYFSSKAEEVFTRLGKNPYVCVRNWRTVVLLKIYRNHLQIFFATEYPNEIAVLQLQNSPHHLENMGYLETEWQTKSFQHQPWQSIFLGPEENHDDITWKPMWPNYWEYLSQHKEVPSTYPGAILYTPHGKQRSNNKNCP